MKKFLIILAIIIVSGLVLAGIGFGVYWYYSNYQPEVLANDNSQIEINTNQEVNLNQTIDSPEVTKVSFATWDAEPASVTPSVASYSVDDDLSQVTNADLLEYFSDEAKQQLAENNFLVVHGYSQEFFKGYETNRYEYTPNFVTSDSILHTYHLYFNYLLEEVENQYLISEAENLTQDMYDQSLVHYQALKGTDWGEAALQEVGFFNVALKILDPQAEVNPLVKDKVEAELSLIEAHGQLTDSPLWDQSMKEDYTQYIPRGHYDKSEELKKYFKAMMWYGRLSFRFKDAKETKVSALITTSLNDSEIFSSWDKIYEPTNFFVGKSDDISYYELQPILAEVYGSSYNLTDLTDSTKFSSFWDKAKALDAPKLNSMPIMQDDDLEEETKAFRFMGQRYTIDADVFQNLIYRQVEENDDNQKRMLPKALDIPAAMGSQEAYNILDNQGETEYDKYPTNMQNMQQYIAGLDQDTWTQNLYWSWMYTLRPLIEVKSDGYPSFMTNDAWTRKQLMTYLGSWTELKHDTILYAKQVYAELGGGPIEQKDDRGYVEPQPELYTRLAGLVKLTRYGLKDRQLLSSSAEESLTKLHTLITDLENISEKELTNEKLTDDEYELIRAYGGSLEHFWLETFTEEEKNGKSTEDLLNDDPAPLVTDVATDPNGQILEEATGFIDNIYVIVPVDGQLKITKGGVYSHYEFSYPLDQRLTDQAWRDILTTEDVPDRADWHSSFFLADPYEY